MANLVRMLEVVFEQLINVVHFELELVPDLVGSGSAKFFVDAFDRIEFGGVGRQELELDFRRGELVPGSVVPNDQELFAWEKLSDFFEEDFGHRLIDGGKPGRDHLTGQRLRHEPEIRTFVLQLPGNQRRVAAHRPDTPVIGDQADPNFVPKEHPPPGPIAQGFNYPIFLKRS